MLILIRHKNITFLKTFHKPIYTINLNEAINSVTGLTVNIVFAAVKVILDTGSRENRNCRSTGEQLRPVVFDRPAPAVTIIRVRVNIPQIVSQDTGKVVTQSAGQIQKSPGTRAAKLKLDANPMNTGITVTLSGLIIDTNQHIRLLRANISSKALVAALSRPRTGTGNILLIIRITNNSTHI